MREKIYKIIDGAKEEGRNFLLELEAEEIFKLYGISIPDSILVEEDNLLIPSSEKLGFPLVMKIVSPQIIHKTDVGGVKIGIKNRDELITAYKSMIVETKEKVSGAEIRGVLL
ncbi:acetate--CoA ligase family protein, partial [Candidatus Calescamantes bacterium]|nr:acetate--CoA ligase family protein [Candidatus Calescamantes bacterium]